MTGKHASSLTAAAFVAAAYAVAPALAGTVSNDIIPIAGVIGDACTGEALSYSGTAHETFRVTGNANSFHIGLHQNIHVDATGLSSGAKYVGLQNDNLQLNLAAGANQTEQFRFRLVSQGKAENLWATAKFHITINANGVVTSFLNSFTVECR